MPRIYLSPSTQENNLYISGGSEEYYMNLIADDMIPYLVSNAISYTRNNRNLTAASAIAQSNASTYDLHLALHSNASAPQNYGGTRGIIVFYDPRSTQGRRAAEIFAKNLKFIYPLPNLVRAQATTTIGEVTRTRAPSVFLELGYHDNEEDAAWIKDNINRIAQTLVYSLTEYFGIPFIYPINPRSGRVNVSSGNLNLRQKPSTTAPIIARMPNNSAVTVTGEWQGWYVVWYRGTPGYADARYITIT